ncbi:hypothetical protein ZWY2020_008485, partial [Hordeum vulgare]
RRRLASLPSCYIRTRPCVLKLKRKEDFIINSDTKVAHLPWQNGLLNLLHNGTPNFGRSPQEYINQRCFEFFT